MEQPTKATAKVINALDSFDLAEQKQQGQLIQPEQDDFQDEIKETAKGLLTAIKKATSGPYALEATEVAKLTSAVCDLQKTFFGKDEKATGHIIMTNQLSMFKDML